MSDQGWLSRISSSGSWFPRNIGIISVLKGGGGSKASSLNLVVFSVLMYSSVKMNRPLLKPLLSALREGWDPRIVTLWNVIMGSP